MKFNKTDLIGGTLLILFFIEYVIGCILIIAIGLSSIGTKATIITPTMVVMPVALLTWTACFYFVIAEMSPLATNTRKDGD